MSLNQCDDFVMLNPIDEWKSGMTKEELIEAMSKKLESEVPGVASFGFMQSIEMRVNELIAGTRGELRLNCSAMIWMFSLKKAMRSSVFLPL